MALMTMKIRVGALKFTMENWCIEAKQLTAKPRCTNLVPRFSAHVGFLSWPAGHEQQQADLYQASLHDFDDLF